ncbi:Uncharacterised protein [Mycolicibacterium vanbaalenii]|uniref:Uncharacterized protein n=1 Tax=Mycolicibacterium vanbaalenii TaxID=110539 RepID=A0A5S9RA73_MYCVN|nr:hypothetical protein [Mycolicibacterium vanbaalenii]CAA0136352.1 Uncharacterised protein [Mycolicibacterium vanbaalenii]
MNASRLQDVLDAHLNEGLGAHTWECSCGVTDQDERDMTHGEHQAAVWRAACTIHSVALRDALSVGSVVVYEDERAVFKSLPRPGVQSPAWIQPGSRYESTADEVPLPALLLWSPDWSE